MASKKNQDKLRLKMFTEELCPKCICGAKSPKLLEVTDTHVIHMNYLGVREEILLESYDEIMRSAGVYNSVLDAYLDDTLPEKVAVKRRKRVELKVVCQTQEAPTSSDNTKEE